MVWSVNISEDSEVHVLIWFSLAFRLKKISERHREELINNPTKLQSERLTEKDRDYLRLGQREMYDCTGIISF